MRAPAAATYAFCRIADDLIDICEAGLDAYYHKPADLVTIALYALNIVDANVDAHLKQYNVDENLSMNFQPYLELTPISADPNYGLAVIIRF